MSPRTILRGLHPQPLASYLAALGVLRICATQHAATIRGAFCHEGFVLLGVDRTELSNLLLDAYVPTPVLAPWNNASGFYDSSKGGIASAAMEQLIGSKEARFAPLVRAVQQIRMHIKQRGYKKAPDGKEKADFIASLRSTLPDDCIAWIDAVAVVDEDDARMMPVLGSGGNEGVLEYSGLFLRSIVETLLADRVRSAGLLSATLDSTPTLDLVERAGGQFDPGTAGGFNTGPGFESKDLPKNPWSFVLLVEGSLLWTSALASRQQGAESGYRFAVSPFTVRHRAAGYASAGYKDGDPQRVRAEVWVPVWRKPATISEIGCLISEGRVDVRGRRGSTTRATDSLDFADAVSSLGVDRGVESFVRYAFVKRRGDSYLALPAGALDVRFRRDVDLIRQVDGELSILDGFLRSFPGDGPPAQLVSRRRAIDDARFDVAQRGGPDAMRLLVRAIGALEMVLVRRDPGKEPKLWRPLGGLSPEWIDACGDDSEVRLAAALASIGSTGGAGPIRMYLAPLHPDDSHRFAPAARTRAWAGVDLSDRLANVLRRRLLDAGEPSDDRAATERNPTWGARSARLSDIAHFLARDTLDEGALEELLFGFTWIAANRSRPIAANASGPPLPRAYALLKLLFLPDGLLKNGERVHINPDLTVVALLRAGRVSDAVDAASRRLVAKGFRPRRVVDVGVQDAEFGRRLAASLLIPVSGARVLIASALNVDFEPTGSEMIAEYTETLGSTDVH